MVLLNINSSRVNRQEEEGRFIVGHAENSIQIGKQNPPLQKRNIIMTLENANIITDSFLLVLSYTFSNPCDVSDFLSIIEIYY